MKKIGIVLVCIFSLLLIGCSNATTNKVTGTNTGKQTTTTFDSSYTKISNAEELQNINKDLDGKYVLINDITLTSSFTPIGNKKDPFEGTFNGQGYTIYGLTIDISELDTEYKDDDNDSVRKTYAYIGLFGCTKDSSIMNVKLSGVDINGTYTMGVKKHSSYEFDPRLYVGGLVGYNEDGEIDEVEVNGEINVTSTNTKIRGGLICGWNSGNVSNCSSAGKFTATTDSETNRIGGLVGANETGDVSLSSFLGTVTGNSSTGKVMVGGIVGILELGTISTSSNSGVVLGKTDEAAIYCGGIVGVIEGGEVSKSYSTGDVTSQVEQEKSAYAGGIVGYFGSVGTGTVSYCFSYGTISASSQIKNAYAGGIAGRMILDVPADFILTLTNCFTNAAIIADGVDAYAGTVIGYKDTGTVSDIYYGNNQTLTTNKLTTVNGESVASSSFIDIEWLGSIGFSNDVWVVIDGNLGLK